MYDEQIASGLIAGLGAFLGIFILIIIAICVLMIVASVKVYKKAGKEGWEAIVPFYSTWVLCEIAGLQWWFFLLISATAIFNILGLAILTPLAGLISLAATFACNYNLAIKFDKDPIGYGIGLTLLPIVFYPILAFSDAKFTDKKVSTYGPIPEEKVSNLNSTNSNNNNASKSKSKFCKNCGAEVTDGKYCTNCGTEIH